mmetsp:Transcript_19391/g.65408  ORF Transcript_19391/g.65408 Transcript_19391/m.65408 type:complete len:293 (+) Transcript_19391:650-1528(+)
MARRRLVQIGGVQPSPSAPHIRRSVFIAEFARDERHEEATSLPPPPAELRRSGLPLSPGASPTASPTGSLTASLAVPASGTDARGEQSEPPLWPAVRRPPKTKRVRTAPTAAKLVKQCSSADWGGSQASRASPPSVGLRSTGAAARSMSSSAPGWRSSAPEYALCYESSSSDDEAFAAQATEFSTLADIAAMLDSPRPPSQLCSHTFERFSDRYLCFVQRNHKGHSGRRGWKLSALTQLLVTITIVINAGGYLYAISAEMYELEQIGLSADMLDEGNPLKSKSWSLVGLGLC